MMSVTAVNQETFEKQVLQSSLPVLVDYWASWCGPCRMLSPIVDEIAQEKADVLKVCKVNTDEQSDLAQAAGIQYLPTLILYKEGKAVKSITGYHPKDEVLAWLE